MRHRLVALGATTIVLIASGSLAPAQTISTSQSGDGWRFIVVPYLWATAMNGEIAVRGNAQDVDLAFSDLFDKVDVAAQIHFEAMSPRWGGFLDTTYVKASDDFDDPGGTGMAEMTYSLTEVAAFLRWFKPPHRNLDLILGVRYWSVDQTIAPSVVPPESESNSWADFMVGLRLSSNFAEWWLVVFRFDVAAGGSDPSVNTSLGFHYIFPKLVSIEFGYRYLMEDYEDGTGSERFALDLTMDGPVVGVGFRW